MFRFIVFSMLIFSIFLGCKEDVKKRAVDLEQIETDNSNNYRYIFKEKIEDEKKEKEKYKENEFK